MSEESKELGDEELERVSGGFTVHGKKIPDGYVYCELSADYVFCNRMCKLHGTSDCVEHFCNPSAAKE